MLKHQPTKVKQSADYDILAAWPLRKQGICGKDYRQIFQTIKSKDKTNPEKINNCWLKKKPIGRSAEDPDKALDNRRKVVTLEVIAFEILALLTGDTTVKNYILQEQHEFLTLSKLIPNLVTAHSAFRQEPENTSIDEWVDAGLAGFLVYNWFIMNYDVNSHNWGINKTTQKVVSVDLDMAFSVLMAEVGLLKGTPAHPQSLDKEDFRQFPFLTQLESDKSIWIEDALPEITQLLAEHPKFNAELPYHFLKVLLPTESMYYNAITRHTNDMDVIEAVLTLLKQRADAFRIFLLSQSQFRRFLVKNSKVLDKLLLEFDHYYAKKGAWDVAGVKKNYQQLILECTHWEPIIKLTKEFINWKKYLTPFARELRHKKFIQWFNRLTRTLTLGLWRSCEADDRNQFIIDINGLLAETKMLVAAQNDIIINMLNKLIYYLRKLDIHLDLLQVVPANRLSPAYTLFRQACDDNFCHNMTPVVRTRRHSIS